MCLRYGRSVVKGKTIRVIVSIPINQAKEEEVIIKMDRRFPDGEGQRVCFLTKWERAALASCK